MCDNNWSGAGKTAFVSGASRGIGRAIAAVFAKQGYDLVLTCLHSIEELQVFAQELEAAHGIRCRALLADMGSAQDVEAAFRGLERLDILINNAGISYIGLLHQMTEEEWRRLMSVNLDSLFYTCRMAIPLMLSEQKGRIINISSVWGRVGASMEAAYSASKGGMDAFTRALAKELAPSGIAVNAVSCGAIDTEMNDHLSCEDRAALTREIPADRWGTPEEVADCVWQIANSPAYMTGQIITIDGGWC